MGPAHFALTPQCDNQRCACNEILSQLWQAITVRLQLPRMGLPGFTDHLRAAAYLQPALQLLHEMT